MKPSFVLLLLGFFSIETWACETSFRLTPMVNESVEVKMTTKIDSDKKQIKVEDDDGFLSAYLMAGYLKSQTEDGAKIRKDLSTMWAEQVQKVAMTFWRGVYQDMLSDALTSRKGANLKREDALKMISYVRNDLMALAEEVRKTKRITTAQLNRFLSAMAPFPSVFSYATGKSQPKFKASDLPKAITGLDNTGVCQGKITKFEVMPLKVIAEDLTPPIPSESEEGAIQ